MANETFPARTNAAHRPISESQVIAAVDRLQATDQGQTVLRDLLALMSSKDAIAIDADQVYALFTLLGAYWGGLPATVDRIRYVVDNLGCTHPLVNEHGVCHLCGKKSARTEGGAF